MKKSKKINRGCDDQSVNFEKDNEDCEIVKSTELRLMSEAEALKSLMNNKKDLEDFQRKAYAYHNAKFTQLKNKKLKSVSYVKKHFNSFQTKYVNWQVYDDTEPEFVSLNLTEDFNFNIGINGLDILKVSHHNDELLELILAHYIDCFPLDEKIKFSNEKDLYAFYLSTFEDEIKFLMYYMNKFLKSALTDYFRAFFIEALFVCKSYSKELHSGNSFESNNELLQLYLNKLSERLDINYPILRNAKRTLISELKEEIFAKVEESINRRIVKKQGGAGYKSPNSNLDIQEAFNLYKIIKEKLKEIGGTFKTRNYSEFINWLKDSGLIKDSEPLNVYEWPDVTNDAFLACYIVINKYQLKRQKPKSLYEKFQKLNKK